MSSLEGQFIGEFKILTRIGQGGMGSVYLAEQASLNRRVAVKVLLPELAHDVEFPKRFKREAMIAASISHPGIVQVYGAGEVDSVYYIAMEYVDGESLQRRMEREGRIKPDDALGIVTQLARALDAAWQKARLIHRDVKPSNVLLSTDGEVKLADFGMARNADVESTLTSTGMPIGTPLYISPEQARCHKDLDFSTDIYSLGCTLYHMLCGRAPYGGDGSFAVMLQHVTEPLPSILTHMPECPKSIVELLDRMLAKDPKERPASYPELIGLLRAAQTGQDKLPASRPRRRTAPVIAVAVLAVGAALGWYGLKKSSISAGSVSAQPAIESGKTSPSKASPSVSRPVAAPVKISAEEFKKAVAALPVREQTQRVIDRLKELNPEFNPESVLPAVLHKGAVIQFEMSIKGVRDISPLSALPSLQKLRLGQQGQTASLTSLEALRGLPLKTLDCHNAPINDLSPLTGMPLVWLVCSGSQVSNLEPIKDCPIAALGINDTKVTDLSPIEKMPLTIINLGVTTVSDLSPLRGMPLEELNCTRTKVSSLAPIAALKLKKLICTRCPIQDFSPLIGMPLKEIELDFEANRDAHILRTIATLEKINGKSAEDFWKEN